MENYSEDMEKKDKYKKNFKFYKYINLLHKYNDTNSDKKKTLEEILTFFESQKEDIENQNKNDSNDKLVSMAFNGVNDDLTNVRESFISCSLHFIKDNMTSVILYLLRLLFFKYNLCKDKPKRTRSIYRPEKPNAMAIADHKELRELYDKYINKNDNIENIMFVTLYASIY